MYENGEPNKEQGTRNRKVERRGPWERACRKYEGAGPASPAPSHSQCASFLEGVLVTRLAADRATLRSRTASPTWWCSSTSRSCRCRPRSCRSCSSASCRSSRSSGCRCCRRRRPSRCRRRRRVHDSPQIEPTSPTQIESHAVVAAVASAAQTSLQRTCRTTGRARCRSSRSGALQVLPPPPPPMHTPAEQRLARTAGAARAAAAVVTARACRCSSGCSRATAAAAAAERGAVRRADAGRAVPARARVAQRRCRTMPLLPRRHVEELRRVRVRVARAARCRGRTARRSPATSGDAALVPPTTIQPPFAGVVDREAGVRIADRRRRRPPCAWLHAVLRLEARLRDRAAARAAAVAPRALGPAARVASP